MSRRLLLSLIGLACFAAFGDAQAQPIQAAPEPDWSVPEIVVTAPMPRMWRLVKGASTVWVLGVIPLPRGLKWNTAAVTHVLDKADRVILPPRTEVGLFQAMEAASRSHLPKGRTLDGEFSPDLSAEYRSVMHRIGRDPAKYQTEKPAWAALMLDVDLMQTPGFDTREPAATVMQLAQAKHIPVSHATYRSDAMLDQLVSLPDDEGRAALSIAIAGADFALVHQDAAGAAWAAGRVAAVRANITPASSATALLLHTPVFQALAARSIDDTVSAIDHALSQPGTTLELMSLPSLAQKDGALDRLRAQGVEISEPAE
jgi:uncharacterized protein YbaP (TraB family)